MRLLILISAVLLSCNTSKKINDHKPVIIEKGILVFSDLKTDYFFPFSDTSDLSQGNYQSKNLKTGFLLTNVNPSYKWGIKKISDTLSNEFNYPFTNIIAVEIEYYKSNLYTDTILKDTYLVLSNTKRKLVYDGNHRFVRNIKPLFR